MNLLKRFLIVCCLLLVWRAGAVIAADPADLARKFKQLPTVPEAEQKDPSNQPGKFRGKIHGTGLTGSTWASFPAIENPASIAFDRMGRLYVSEANRFWLGVPDLRGANEMVQDDFKSVTVEDRLKMYEKFKSHFPEGWFTKVADRIIRLEDRDKNGAADRRTLFSNHFRHAEDGLGFSLLADEDGIVYFTCVPKVWKLTDDNDDGVADTHEAIASGFGVRVSFIGHDLHGITRGPDGLLYFSVGDRGYHLKDGQGNWLEGSGKGAIFRCESDGSGLELYCEGLRNPQELAFDDYGNLFTFDNTGDIGDRARMVYVLEGTDSGWNMAHQSAHHYVQALDWGDFHPPKSMWVAERMFDLFKPGSDQPQWVYPPASHVGEGPSGVTFLTGLSLPENLRDRFLLTNYRGDPGQSNCLFISHEKQGAGYRAAKVETLVSGVAASDAELGFDGKIYLCDFGGGWAVNTNGSIQVIASTDPAHQAEGAKVAALFASGFPALSAKELSALLSHPDRRVRQAAQFALADKEGGAQLLTQTAFESPHPLARLHALWGIGQILRASGHLKSELVRLAADKDEEIRANAVRVLGDNRIEEALEPVFERFQKDESLRVRSLAAIALSRIAKPGDAKVVDAVYAAAVKNGGNLDVVLRHALLTAMSRLGTPEAAVARLKSASEEERLLAVLFLRRKGSPELREFLSDPSALIRRETIRAIYDTSALDTKAGVALAEWDAKGETLPPTVQRRLIAAHYRLGQPENAKRLVSIAAGDQWDHSVRKAALQGLFRWEDTVNFDPVHGHYRPLSYKVGSRTMAGLKKAIEKELNEFFSSPQPDDLLALATRLAGEIGIQLSESTLITQAENPSLDAGIRIAALDLLAKTPGPRAAEAIAKALEAKDPAVQACALEHAFDLNLPNLDLDQRAVEAIIRGPIPVARAAIRGTARQNPARWETIWNIARDDLRPELKLDAYEATRVARPDLAAAFAASSPRHVILLCRDGGDPVKGQQVYLNQGGCRQCHLVHGEGGVQGPDLSSAGLRLSRQQILTSLYDPGAEISPGYGVTNIFFNDGNTLMARLTKEEEKQITVVAMDGTESVISRTDIRDMTPPISVMPPIATVLDPKDLRDLVAYISSLKGGEATDRAEAHGK